jgi:hypothetical protein
MYWETALSCSKQIAAFVTQTWPEQKWTKSTKKISKKYLMLKKDVKRILAPELNIQQKINYSKN